MTFQDSIRTCLGKYVAFSGRARRPEFWWFALFVFIGAWITGAIDRMLFGSDFGVLGPIFGLAMLLPYISVAVRRLHDTDKSGWWILIGLIPLVGVLVLIYFYIQEGTKGANTFGPEPRVVKRSI